MTESPIFLSVVVPTRNRAAVLHDCIAGLINQDFPAAQYEVVVMDDGSSDETPDVVSALLSRTHVRHLRYIRREGHGLNSARNAGIRETTGDPVAFVDDDVLVPRAWLRAVAEGIIRHPEASCFGGPVLLRLEGKAPRLCDRDTLGETELDFGVVERYVELVVGANLCVRRNAIEMAGWFDESLPLYGDETEWEMRLTNSGGRIVYLPEAWLWHRRTAQDLRLLHLIRAKFRKGIANVAFARATGQHMSVMDEIAPIPRLLAHAVRRRCAGGLLSVSGRAGRVWGLIAERVRDLLVT